MTHVLVVDDDVMFARTVIRQVQGMGLTVEYAQTPQSAFEILDSSAPDIALVDLDLVDTHYDGIKLIGKLRSLAPTLQPVLMSAVASARDYKAAMRQGAVEVLVKPFTREELRSALDRAIACETGIHGMVHGVSLVEMLQMYHFSRRPVTLLFEGRQARIDMKNGEIVHAVAGDLVGERALTELLSRPGTSVATAVLQSEETTISRRFDAVLLDALRTLDERGRAPTQTDTAVADWSPDDDDLEIELTFGDDDEGGEVDEPLDNQTEEQGEIEMGKIDDSCKQVVDNTDGGIACGVVDLDTGMLLGIYNSAQYSQSLNEIVAAAAVDMFRGSNVGRIQKAVRKHRGVPEDGGHYIEEVQFSSINNYHFCKTVKHGKAVIILVTNKNTNVGMGWAQLKSVIPEVEPLIP